MNLRAAAIASGFVFGPPVWALIAVALATWHPVVGVVAILGPFIVFVWIMLYRSECNTIEPGDEP